MSKTFLNWSSGKDSSLTLHELIKKGSPPDLLFTVINKETQRVGLHGLRRELVERQANAIGIPLRIVELSESLDHEAYNQLMFNECSQLVKEGFSTSIFGDIFLEDLRAYREKELKKVGLQAEFPLWKKDTSKLLQYFIDEGFKACIVAANTQFFDPMQLGCDLDQIFLDNLPEQVDPCGENGEFHSFCYDGPIFEASLSFSQGEKVIKTYPNPSRTSDSEEIKFCFIELY